LVAVASAVMIRSFNWSVRAVCIAANISFAAVFPRICDMASANAWRELPQLSIEN
jgi:hypothetical protein